MSETPSQPATGQALTPGISGEAGPPGENVAAVEDAVAGRPDSDRPSRSPRRRGNASDGPEPPASTTSPPQDSVPVGETGFERSTDTLAPHLVRFENVPEHAKFPNGPYRQAPEEYGGDWWQVNPFTGPEPWLRLDHVASATEEPDSSSDPSAAPLPEGFVELFGPEPERRDFRTSRDYQIAEIKWRQDLKYFRGAGTPPGIDEEKLNLSLQAFEEWGLGRPQFYEGRYGWRVRFPESQVPDFEMMPSTALQAPHIIIARYQIRLLRDGFALDRPHPWIPPHLLSRYAATPT